VVDNELREKREEYELAGCCAGREHSEGEAAMGVEPALYNGRAENDCDDACANTYQYAPECEELPRMF